MTFGREGALCRPDNLAWVLAELDKLVPGFVDGAIESGMRDGQVAAGMVY